ncbi:MAG TPA: diacylglycerol kinase family protein [Allosphingosinicella sp.]|jgi:diacylglycerol kinase family enzyme
MTDRQTVQFFYNKMAGRHCLERLSALRSRFEANGAQVILSECGPGIDISIAEEASHVCTIGGDGTVRHVALALSRCDRALALSVYPGGTVNLLHREIASPTDPDLHALRVLRGDALSQLYSVEINDSLFLACASVGPDSRAVASVSPALKRRIGRAAYAIAFLRLLLRWQRQTILLSWDGGPQVSCEAFYVAKGRFFAGPWSFAPSARISEPLLHVAILERAKRWDYARFIWAMIRGKAHKSVPGVRLVTCTTLDADAATPLPVQADGDVVASLPVRIRLRPAPLPLC